MAIHDQNTTLGDINRIDRDNFDYLIKNAKTYRFDSPKQAQLFMGRCVDKILRKCGVKIKPSMDGNRIGRMMASRAIKVEHRVYNDKEELERSQKDKDSPRQTGLYIYSKKEIAAFVSSPFQHDGAIIMPGVYIRTTVKDVI